MPLEQMNYSKTAEIKGLIQQTHYTLYITTTFRKYLSLLALFVLLLYSSTHTHTHSQLNSTDSSYHVTHITCVISHAQKIIATTPPPHTHTQTHVQHPPLPYTHPKIPILRRSIVVYLYVYYLLSTFYARQLVTSRQRVV